MMENKEIRYFYILTFTRFATMCGYGTEWLLESRHRVLCGVGLKLKHPCVLLSFLILVSRLYFSFFFFTNPDILHSE